MTARIKRKRAVRKFELLVLRCLYSNLKTNKALSDFPHDAIGNHLLRFTIPKNSFSILESYLYNCFHIKGKGAQQIFSCLPQCRRLYLWDDGSKFFIRYLFRNGAKFCAVFFCSAAVSVLCVAGIVESAVFAAGV